LEQQAAQSIACLIRLSRGDNVKAAQESTTTYASEDMPTITHPRVKNGFQPEYAVQYYSRDIANWKFWDCAYTRSHADNLLASYIMRYRAEGREWRLAKIIYLSE
jgi:hypothetical protein